MIHKLMPQYIYALGENPGGRRTNMLMVDTLHGRIMCDFYFI